LVPVLVDGDVVLDDEDKIIEYLDSKYGENKRGGQ
jgi:glutathione S-transferase